ncbi:MAG: hypothetical protein HYS27_07410 [Deltaproteobacteria bacterium]|nr:hypothetical protein [Deltaproteobacteria bacterium]
MALLTITLAGAPRTAVVDLSVPPVPALAAALRELPALKGGALNAAQTELIVADAAGLGLSCDSDDDACLQKLVVLARVDQLIALDASADEVRLVRASAAGVHRVAARVAGSDATRARVAWGALQRALAPARPPVHLDEQARAPLVESATDRPAEAASSDPAVPAAPVETPTASTGGVTAPLVVGMSGAGAALVLGAGTVGVSAALAQQLRGTQRGIPLDDSYDTLQLAFWSLSAATTAAVVTSAVGLALFLTDDDGAASAP